MAYLFVQQTMSQCWHMAGCLATLSKKRHMASQTHRFARMLRGSILRGGSSISVHSPSVPPAMPRRDAVIPVCQLAVSVPGHSMRMPVCIPVIQRDCRCGGTSGPVHPRLSKSEYQCVMV